MGNLDAFGRLRVSDPQTLFDYQSQYDDGSLLWESVLTGSGTATHSANTASVSLAVTAASGDKVVRQTREYHRYQPGKSQLVLATFVAATPKTNLRQRLGYFDANDGIFLQTSSTTISIVRRTSTSGSPVDTTVNQADWNIDKFDGTGPSRMTLDVTKGNILFIDMEWLGVGRVRAGFVTPDGRFCVAHEFQNANALTAVYMKTANLPVRYEIENLGTTSGSSTLEAICTSVISEGGFEDNRGLPFSTSSGTTVKSVTTEVPILSIRPKATFNSIVNRGQIIPQQVSSYVDTTGARFRLIYNPTLTGAAFGSVDNSSIVEVDTTASAFSAGLPVAAWYQPASASGTYSAQLNEVLSRLPLSLNISGANPIVLTLAAARIGGTGTCNVLASINWKELR
jgi:hypothetical protein